MYFPFDVSRSNNARLYLCCAASVSFWHFSVLSCAFRIYMTYVTLCNQNRGFIFTQMFSLFLLLTNTKNRSCHMLLLWLTVVYQSLHHLHHVSLQIVFRYNWYILKSETTVATVNTGRHDWDCTLEKIKTEMTFTPRENIPNWNLWYWYIRTITFMLRNYIILHQYIYIYIFQGS